MNEKSSERRGEVLVVADTSGLNPDSLSPGEMDHGRARCQLTVDVIMGKRRTYLHPVSHHDGIASLAVDGFVMQVERVGTGHRGRELSRGGIETFTPVIKDVVELDVMRRADVLFACCLGVEADVTGFDVCKYVR